MKATKKQVIKFFKEKIKERVDDNTVFFTDFGYTGLDAELLLEELGKEFNIDMQEFKYSEYFHAVPFFPFGHYISALFGRPQKQKKTLSLDELVQIINMGKWPPNE